MRCGLDQTPAWSIASFFIPVELLVQDTNIRISGYRIISCYKRATLSLKIEDTNNETRAISPAWCIYSFTQTNTQTNTQSSNKQTHNQATLPPKVEDANDEMRARSIPAWCIARGSADQPPLPKAITNVTTINQGFPKNSHRLDYLKHAMRLCME